MEGINKIESFLNFDSLLNRIEERYKSEGFSDRVRNEIGSWYDRRQFETNGMAGGLPDRIKFQYQFAQLYFATNQIENAMDTLDDALTEAEQTNSPLVDEMGSLYKKCKEIIRLKGIVAEAVAKTPPADLEIN